MTTVKEILDRKSRTNPRPLCAVSPSATVLDAVQAMNRQRIGGVVVLDGEGSAKPVLRGVFTERDVLCRVVGDHRDPAATKVGEVMTPEPVTCHPSTTIDQLKSVMTQQRVRHLPVVDEGRVVGVVTSGDVLAFEASEYEATIRHLHEYITG